MAANRYESSLLRCLHCSARGAITWAAAHGDVARTLVRVSGSFHIETGRTTPGSATIVCSLCDEIHGALPSGRNN